jgi:Fe-S oxidoreductase
MVRDDMAGARKILEKSMPLAGIVARLCEAPCEKYCIRKDLGGAIAVGGLERACMRSTSTAGRILPLPARSKNVRVFGSGPSSLTVAYELAKKGYPVTVIYLGDAPGGWLRTLPDILLPRQAIEEEIARLASLSVDFLGVTRFDEGLWQKGVAEAFYAGCDDAVMAGPAALQGPPDPTTFALPEPGWFKAGLSAPQDEFRLITDVAQGKEAAVSIDRYLQGASLTESRTAPRRGHTNLFTQTKDIAAAERLNPADKAGYSRSEAVREAERCIDCQCLECVRHCVYLEEYGAYPKVYARRVYNNSAIVKGSHQTNRFINSCSLCRQCETLCPRNFSMADLCLEARQTMVREKRMPPSAHWFALEEMRSARRETAFARHAPGRSTSSTLFFPGCQLTGIRPYQSLRLYERLLELEPRTGIWVDCCAAPATWSGRENEAAAIFEKLVEDWRGLGSPRVVAGCSTCLKMFGEHLPDIEIESVWTLLSREPVADVARPRPPLALTDPCTSRHDGLTREAVRTLLDKLGQPLAPLAMDGILTECCGFGGLMANAAPETARNVVEARAAQTEADMLTYCAMCRDRLARTGKPVLHILDLLFDDLAHPPGQPPVSLSARRANRRLFRAELAAKYPAVDDIPREPWQDIALEISAEVAASLETRRILQDDIRQVLNRAKEEGRFFAHVGEERKIACATLGEVTFWVEYVEENGSYRVLSCWSHRMIIDGGGA